MDQRAKCKTQKYKFLEENIEKNLDNSGRWWVFRYNIKSMSHEKKINWNSLNLKTAVKKKLLREIKDKPQTRRKSSQNTSD